MSLPVAERPAEMSSLKKWVLGARPRTLPAALVPVAVGTAATTFPKTAIIGGQEMITSGVASSIIWWRALAAVVVALALQIGTNYANDYSDGIRGTDEDRVGPLRLVGSGLVPARHVKIAAFTSFFIAALAGLALAAATTWWLLAIGALAIAAGWFYTGGPKPYGYLGLGEIFVFVFFGLVATCGSAFVQDMRISGLDVLVAIPVGLLATALLEANNIRDIDGDLEANKRTVAVRLGRKNAGVLYIGCIGGAALSILATGIKFHWVWLGLLEFTAIIPALKLVRSDANGRALLPVLAMTARLQLKTGVLLTLGLIAASQIARLTL